MSRQMDSVASPDCAGAAVCCSAAGGCSSSAAGSSGFSCAAAANASASDNAIVARMERSGMRDMNPGFRFAPSGLRETQQNRIFADRSVRLCASLYQNSSEQTELPAVRLAAPELRLLVPEQLGLDVGEERRGRERAELAAPQALLGAREDQAVLGAGHADVEQPAFLRQGVVVARAPGERQDAVLEPGDEHRGKLEPLGGVQGEERDA